MDTNPRRQNLHVVEVTNAALPQILSFANKNGWRVLAVAAGHVFEDRAVGCVRPWIVTMEKDGTSDPERDLLAIQKACEGHFVGMYI